MPKPLRSSSDGVIFRLGRLAILFLVWLVLNQCTPSPTEIRQAAITHQLFLPAVFSSRDSRFGVSGGWGDTQCQSNDSLLGMACAEQHQLLDSADVETFQTLGWYEDWEIIPPHACTWNTPYATLQQPVLCGQWIREHPGKAWIIGNEYNCGTICGMEQLTNVQYAKMYHDATTLVKANDPTAKIITAAYGGIHFCDVEWQSWLGEFVSIYRVQYGGINPDGWGFHIYQYGYPANPYPFDELDCFIADLRQLGIVPQVWVTEFGWNGFDSENDTPANSIAFMRAFIEKMRNTSEVTRWFWWTSWGAGSRLFASTALTSVGQCYRSIYNFGMCD